MWLPRVFFGTPMPSLKNVVIFTLIAAGTVGATLGVARSDPAAKNWERTYQVDTVLTAVSLVLLLAGIVVRYATAGANANGAAAASGSLALFREAISALGERLAELCADVQSIDWEDNRLHDLYDEAHQSLDTLVSGPLADAIDNRQALVDRFGMAAYARVMGPFATAERYLNRAWSASADGYPEETMEYLRRAVPALEEARRELEAVALEETSSTGEPHYGQA
jgi:hypothetical protein